MGGEGLQDVEDCDCYEVCVVERALIWGRRIYISQV
jgi:hypothetical protein